MNPNSVTASAPGNVFLCGEYGVLSGTPAILLAPSQRCVVRCAAIDEGSIWLRSHEYCDVKLPIAADRDETDRIPGGLGALVGLIDSYLGNGGRGVRLDIASEIPAGAGMSSSTAVLVSLAAALSASFGYRVDPPSLLAKALPWQAEIHGGRASGVEFFSSLYGGIHWVENSSATALPLSELPPVVIADTGLRRSTATGVVSYKDQPSFVGSLRDICERARAYLEMHDWGRLGEAMSAVHELLRSIGVSNQALDRLVEAAKDAGAWGAKLSGAGGGGVVVVLLPEAATAPVTSALRAAGAVKVFQAHVDRRGVVLE